MTNSNTDTVNVNEYAEFSQALQFFGFDQSTTDYSRFTYEGIKSLVAVLVYVDDLLL